MFVDDVAHDVVLGLAVVDAQHGTALDGAVDAHRGNTGLSHAPGNGFPYRLEHDLIALYEQAVELVQVHQVVYAVFAAIPSVVEILAEAVEYAQAHIRVVVHVLSQAVQRAFHKIVIPIHREKSDPILVHGIAPVRNMCISIHIYNNTLSSDNQGEKQHRIVTRNQEAVSKYRRKNSFGRYRVIRRHIWRGLFRREDRVCF